MYIPIEYKDLEKLDEYLLIDVRTPSEYGEATINDAINLPIFNDEERELIGTIYVQESVEKAKKIGVEIASKKLPEIYQKILEMKQNHQKIIFFCARGGMRSGVLTSIVSEMGIDVTKLQGGYKAYRNFVVSQLPKLNEEVDYIVLHGNTGVGKTEILKKLKINGYNVLDLEGDANHRGSLLGHVGLGKTNSQKQFESNVFHALSNTKGNYVFVEAESSRIGSVSVPKYILDKMKLGKHIYLDAGIDFRTNVILNEYTRDSDTNSEIVKCLEKLNKYISNENIERYKMMINNNNYEDVSKELMVNYYDPLYSKSAKRYEYELEIYIDNFEDVVKQIEEYYEELER